jgi:hypothetical protein
MIWIAVWPIAFMYGREFFDTLYLDPPSSFELIALLVVTQFILLLPLLMLWMMGPIYQYKSEEIEAFHIALNTLRKRVSNDDGYVLVLRPFDPKLRRTNMKHSSHANARASRIHRGGPPPVGGSVKRRMAAFDKEMRKVRELLEMGTFAALDSTPTFTLFNEAVGSRPEIFHLPAREDWIPFFKLLAEKATLIVLVLEDQLKPNLMTEVDYISDHGLQSKTLVIRRREKPELPFAAGWTIVVRGVRHDKEGFVKPIRLPVDFLSRVRALPEVTSSRDWSMLTSFGKPKPPSS